MLEFSLNPPTPTSFMLMPSINSRGQRQNQCAQCGGCLFQLWLLMEENPMQRGKCLRQPEAMIWPQVRVHGTGGQVGLCCPAATRRAYLSCKQPKELSALTVLCRIFFVLA